LGACFGCSTFFASALISATISFFSSFFSSALISATISFFSSFFSSFFLLLLYLNFLFNFFECFFCRRCWSRFVKRGRPGGAWRSPRWWSSYLVLGARWLRCFCLFHFFLYYNCFDDFSLRRRGSRCSPNIGWRWSNLRLRFGLNWGRFLNRFRSF